MSDGIVAIDVIATTQGHFPCVYTRTHLVRVDDRARNNPQNVEEPSLLPPLLLLLLLLLLVARNFDSSTLRARQIYAQR